MPDDEITSVRAWQALDSRGKPTVGVRVTTRGGAEGRAIAPAGASTGTHEARELRDGGTAYQGQGVSRAVENVRAVLAPELVGHSCLNQDDIDATVERADGTTDLGRLGANAAVAVSIAVLCAAGNHARLPLYRHVADRHGVVLPRPMINIISGGAHAAGMIDIQDVLAVPLSARTFAEAVEQASRVRDGTRLILADRGTPTALVADEGGLAAPFESNEAAIAAVSDGIERAGLRPGCDVGIAIDVAANQLMHAGGYALASESRLLTTKGLSDELLRWCTDYPVVSIEDVLSEDDWDGWKDATASLGLGRQLLGDDLFATNAGRLRRGIAAGVANAVLVKPNQAGTLSRARGVVDLARDCGYATVLSARSGDTEDTWLADLAVGWRTGQIKVGSTTRAERTAKWNRLLEIEAEAGPAAQLAPFQPRG
jgi:enolase